MYTIDKEFVMSIVLALTLMTLGAFMADVIYGKMTNKCHTYESYAHGMWLDCNGEVTGYALTEDSDIITLN